MLVSRGGIRIVAQSGCLRSGSQEDELECCYTFWVMIREYSALVATKTLSILVSVDKIMNNCNGRGNSIKYKIYFFINNITIDCTKKAIFIIWLWIKKGFVSFARSCLSCFKLFRLEFSRRATRKRYMYACWRRRVIYIFISFHYVHSFVNYSRVKPHHRYWVSQSRGDLTHSLVHCLL